jgi:hypothetical protein
MLSKLTTKVSALQGLELFDSGVYGGQFDRLVIQCLVSYSYISQKDLHSRTERDET